MNAIRIETIVQADGELHLTQLPCRKGDHVEAIVLLPDIANDESIRDEARRRFVTLARSSKFRSSKPYPTRDELHDRS
jgi:hypothetical protein